VTQCCGFAALPLNNLTAARHNGSTLLDGLLGFVDLLELGSKKRTHWPKKLKGFFVVLVFYTKGYYNSHINFQ